MHVEYDVVVAGGGPAGLLAAIETADAGLRTALIEARTELGGSGALAAGQTVLCETELEPASRELLLEDLRRAHDFDHDDRLARLYVDEAGDTYRRLTELGVHFARSVQLAHMSRPWAHEVPIGEPGGAAIVARLHRAALERGVVIEKSCRLRRLLREAGRVAGVVVTRGEAEAPEESIAARAVVLATGGFTRNRELIRTYAPPAAATIRPITGEASKGDGLLAAMHLGAGTAYLAAGVMPTAPVDPVTEKGTLIFYCGGIVLNADGRRFISESEVYSRISAAAMSQPGGVMVHVYDAECKRRFAKTLWASVDSLTGYQEIEAPTINELLAKVAATTSWSVEAAEQTVATYNRAIRTGAADEVGRTRLTGRTGELFTLTTPPYFAVVTVPGTTHFNGGLLVDAQLRVLDVFGSPLVGLYAAGEIVGGFHGAGYMSGTQWGQAVVFGRSAGRSVAGELTQGGSGSTRAGRA
ncbi:FAD-dependent oxidoreductase [Nocardioides albidus]|uniref:FAD-dependent oxidoreductase n=1 Tax=Nocardioides albidus TaxID=1517589 RepID=A0A5C4VRQ6_9ACTN|nr:FAD-dependent oxidoreductase [Nocardioides albidus]TNM38518.1 FAD-dependent oxidoreductase [Nocardioides albidus]